MTFILSTNVNQEIFSLYEQTLSLKN